MRIPLALMVGLALIAAPDAIPGARAGNDRQGTVGTLPQGESGAWWVFFPPRVSGAESADPIDLTPRARARRARAARELGASAVAPEPDPDPDCVAAVEGTGARIRARSRWLNAVSVDADAATLAAVEALPCVQSIRPVARGRTEAIDAADALEFGPSLRQLELVGVPQAHAIGLTGRGVLIAVLDTGFELGHESIDRLRVQETRDFIYHDRNVDYDPAQDVPVQAIHGTQVLSVLAGYRPGRLVGPAYGADFLLGKTESQRSETVAEEDFWTEAIEWAEARGADIVTSSLSYTRWYDPRDLDGRTAVTTRVANLAFERGLLIVNSAGNHGPGPRTLGAPADALGLITVGSVDGAGRLSEFSSRGPTADGRVKPDVCAMGSGVLHAKAGSRDRYGRGAGTSYAAPLVAGCLALIMEAHPDWGPEMVREALMMTADRADRPASQFGWGIPNVRDAILYPSLEGTVRDAHTLEPLGGAAVAWAPGDRVDSLAAAPGDSPSHGAVRSDSTGAYVIPNLPSGAYRLRVSKPGYFDAVSETLGVPPSLGNANFHLRYRGE